MDDRIATQLYLMAPPGNHTEKLADVLDTGAAACLRLVCTAADPGIEAIRDMCHAREIPLVVEAPEGIVFDLAIRFGLDGVHIPAASKTVAYARKTLGKDAIIGAAAGISRHDAMNAAEAGADYIAFGPTASLDPELIGWWAKVVETPQVIEGCFAPEDAAALAGLADFILAGPDIWTAEDPVTAIKDWLTALESQPGD